MAMEETKANVAINPGFLPFLKGKNSIDENVNLSLAIYLFTAKKLTIKRAAELCEKSLSDFIQILIEHNIHWMEYTEEHTQTDDETIEFIIKEGKNDEGDL